MAANENNDVVIVGAGSAGLSVSHFLQQAGAGHIVLERGEIGESWRSQRWDSFRVNTPNHLNVLVGAPYSGPEPNIFPSHLELVEGWDAYASRQDLPVRTHTAVRHVGRSNDGGFDFETEGSDGLRHVIRTSHVVVAAGGFTVPKVPDVAAKTAWFFDAAHGCQLQESGPAAPGPCARRR